MLIDPRSRGAEARRGAWTTNPPRQGGPEPIRSQSGARSSKSKPVRDKTALKLSKLEHDAI
jgi:hypothetical protein